MYILRKKASIIIIIFLLLIVGSAHQPPTTNADAISVAISADIVNVRDGAGQSHRVIDQVQKGEVYPVENEQDDWLEIRLDSNRTGWVADWLTEKKRIANEHYVISVNHLNVRTEPSTNSEVIGQLHEGDPVVVSNEKNGWSQIKYQSNTAWVSSQYVMESPGENELAVRSNEKKQIAILHNGTNIRKKADINSRVIDKVQAGEVFEKFGQKGDWYQIKLANGKKGYVASWVVSLTDRPVFYKKKTKGIKDKVIVIDPGHGGHDQGAEGITGTLEKDITLETAKLLTRKLESGGAKVIMTRNKDEYIALNNRTAAATIGNADALISIHYDSTDDSITTGHTTYYYHSYEKKLADSIHNHLNQKIDLKNRGVRFGNYYVVRESDRPAVLLELGYLSNQSEEEVIKVNQFQDAATTAIYDGLIDYFSH